MRLMLFSACALLAGCDSVPVTANSRLLVSPYLATYRLRGDLGMASAASPTAASQPYSAFGIGSHEDDFGVRFDLGDGFGGVALDYYRMEANTSRAGTLGADFGALNAGDQASMRQTMDEWRLSYLVPTLVAEGRMRGEPLDLRLALGATAAHRDMSLRVATPDQSRIQNLGIQGDSLYATAKFRARLRQVSFDLQYSFCPDVQIGDFGPAMHDLETRLSYEVPFQDVTAFLGWRYATLPAGGTQDGLPYDSDLTLDGFQFGVQVSF